MLNCRYCEAPCIMERYGEAVDYSCGTSWSNVIGWQQTKECKIVQLTKERDKWKYDHDQLVMENNRLKEGRFNEKEFQNLCHSQQDSAFGRFVAGCGEYWKSLFGHGLFDFKWSVTVEVDSIYYWTLERVDKDWVIQGVSLVDCEIVGKRYGSLVAALSEISDYELNSTAD